MDPVKAGQVYVCDSCGAEFKVLKSCDTICPCCQPTCCCKPLRLKEDNK